MIPEYIDQAAWLGAPVLILVFVAWSREWRWAGALLVGLLALGIGAWKDVVVPDDAAWLLLHSGLTESLAQLTMWTCFAILLRAHGHPAVSGHPLLVAPLMGALMGELAAAALLAASARDSKAAARLALAAAGGAMWGRVGDPALLILWGSELSPMFLGLMGLLCVAIASPRSDDIGETADLDPVATGTCIAVAGMALTQAYALQGLAVGCGVLMFRLRGDIRKVDPRPLGWLIGGVLTVLVAVSGGVPTLAGLGLEELQGMIGDKVLVLMAAAGALLSAICGGPSASLIAEAVLDRSPGLQIESLHTGIAAGLAVGGLGPLVVAGALKEGLLRWGLQVVCVLGICGLILI